MQVLSRGKLYLFFIVFFLLVFLLSNSLFAQAEPDDISTVLFDDAEISLEGAIKNMNRRKAAVAFNIANASTPGFKPIRFRDEVENAIRLYGDSSVLNEVNIDDEMVKATTIRLRHSAYIRLLSTKMAITKKVVTLGKGG